MNTESSALLAHIEALNAKTEAWVAEDPTNRWATTWMTDIDEWAKDGVHTVDDFTKFLLVSDIYETTREIYGYKTSWGALMEMSIEDLKAEAAALSTAAQQHYEESQERIKAEEEDMKYFAEVDSYERWLMDIPNDVYMDSAEAAGFAH